MRKRLGHASSTEESASHYLATRFCEPGQGPPRLGYAVVIPQHRLWGADRQPSPGEVEVRMQRAVVLVTLFITLYAIPASADGFITGRQLLEMCEDPGSDREC